MMLEQFQYGRDAEELRARAVGAEHRERECSDALRDRWAPGCAATAHEANLTIFVVRLSPGEHPSSDRESLENAASRNALQKRSVVKRATDAVSNEAVALLLLGRQETSIHESYL
jgi:hypothetical protein